MKHIILFFIGLAIVSIVACEQEQMPTQSYPEQLTVIDSEVIKSLHPNGLDASNLEENSGRISAKSNCSATTPEQLTACFNGFGNHTPSPGSSCQPANMDAVGFTMNIFPYPLPNGAWDVKRNYLFILRVLDDYVVNCGQGQSLGLPNFQFTYHPEWDMIIVEGEYHCCDD